MRMVPDGPARSARTPTRRATLAIVIVGACALFGAAVPASGQAAGQRFEPARYVDPFIGTGGTGQTWPGPMVPFGMTQWSPMTEPASSSGSGYSYAASTISGFSLTALSAGVPGFSDVSFMPYLGVPAQSPERDLAAYRSGFSHQREEAAAGYYAVTLDGPSTRVELTAADRANLGRFTFPSTGEATLLVRAKGRPQGAADAGFEVVGRDRIQGWVRSRGFSTQGRNAEYTVYFTTTFDRPFKIFGGWSGDALAPGSRTAGGGKSGVYLVFDTTDQRAVTAKAAISYVSVEGAAGNLASAAPSFDLARMRDRAVRSWNDLLGRVRVGGGTEDRRRVFYTALYHTLTQPNVFSDADRRYRAFDGQVRRTGGWAQYANFSGWDAYRSYLPLLAILAPDVASDFAQSLVVDGEQGGGLPRWSIANDEAGTMVGNPGAIALAEAYAFGARDFDTRSALLLMVDGADNPDARNNGYPVRPGLSAYRDHGYLPAREPMVWGPAGTTLEYATADHAIAEFARALGDTATHRRLAARAQNWQNVFNPRTGFVQNRSADGSFEVPFDPLARLRFGFSGAYAEGNAWPYTLMVPQNPAGLVAALGGEEAAAGKLDTFFTKLDGGAAEPYANLGNEPTHNAPWLYNWAGQPWKTQQVVRRAWLELFTPAPTGLFGNDDLGATSAWGVWAALGLYPEIPGTAGLAVHSPAFPEVTIDLGRGRALRIEAPAAADSVPYVHGLRLDGRPVDTAWIDWDRVARKGGTLRFDLAATPSRWGADHRPPSFTEGQAPGLGYVSADRVPLAPGEQASVTLGVRNVQDRPLSVTWRAGRPSGVRISPEGGALTVPAGQRREVTVTVSVDWAAADGARVLDFDLRAPGGRPLPPVAVRIPVATPGNLVPWLDNIAVTRDRDAQRSRFEFNRDRGASLSVEALAAAGIRPGGPVEVDGFRYTWPDVPVGQPDNLVVAGQTISFAPRPGATRLGFLGATTVRPAQGTGTILYTDGSSEPFTLSLSHWTRDVSLFTVARGGGQVMFGNAVAVSMQGMNDSWDGHNATVPAYLYSAAVPVAAGRTIRAVTLPTDDGGGEMHLFAIAQS